MHRVLSMEMSRKFKGPSGFVSKRMCIACLFTVGFITLLGGYILGRFARGRELQLLRLRYRCNTDALQDASQHVIKESAAESYLLQQISGASIHHIINNLDLSHNNDITSENMQHAKYMQQYFTEQGFDSVSSIQPSTVLLSYYNYNLTNKVDIIDVNGGAVFRGSPVLPRSATELSLVGTLVSTRISGRSAVYANFGRESDFLFLRAHNVAVKDAIVLARLGRVEPCHLVETALRHGAKAVLLFGDPQQYPDELERDTLFSPEQLGKLQATHGNAAVGVDGAVGCLPVQVIPASDAEYILRHMTSLGKNSLGSWRGNLSEYNHGPGFIRRDWQLSMVVHMVNIEKIFYNVVAAIKGTHEPDRYVVLANNREATDKGVVPQSATRGGTAAMMELARVLSSLRTTKGWLPRRSIVLCSWGSDLMRSHDAWGFSLETRTVAYLNVDVAVNGNSSINVQATPLLHRLLSDASALIPNPSHSEINAGRRTVYDTWIYRSKEKIPVNNVGSGTEDLGTSIYNHGIPSLDFHYGDRTTQDFRDVNHTYHRAVTQLWGIMTWNLADSLIVPLDITQYAKFLNHSITTVARHHHQTISQQAIPLEHLVEAVNNFINASTAIQNKLETIERSNNLELRIMNDLLFQLDRSFLHHVDKTDSQPRHVVLAPGSYLDHNRTPGFGVLQDLLEDLTCCAEYDHSVCTVELRNHIISHLTVLTHCVTSAAYILQDPLQPLALADL